MNPASPKGAAASLRRVTAPRTPEDLALIGRMAQDLRTYDATASESSAIRCLISRGYGWGDVALFGEDALIEARQPMPAFEAVEAAVAEALQGDGQAPCCKPDQSCCDFICGN